MAARIKMNTGITISRLWTGPDDFASMEEVIYRRYKRQLEENKPLPQLIVVDGGKGQLSAALKSLEQAGLAGKDHNHRHSKKAGRDLLS